MDIRCPVCGEPWDHDELHYVEGMSYQTAWKTFRKRGCEVFGCEHSEVHSNAAMAARMLYDLMPDDPDGCAAMLDELEYFGEI